MNKYSLVIHGGAGNLPDTTEHLKSLNMVLIEGRKMLKNGMTAIDVVEACVSMLENDELFNAGKGAVLTHERTVELDASIMDGENFKAGAVASVRGVKNPIKLARKVMDNSEFVFMVGAGANEFAKEQGFELLSDDYFITTKRKAQLEVALTKPKAVFDITDVDSKKLGTVGAVAMDINGNLAAATSTGGIVNKRYGRVGDSPVIGAGCYADNETCAVSSTGYGEQFLRVVMAKTVSDYIKFKQVDASEAAKLSIEYLVEKVNGAGGVIVVDKNGVIGAEYSNGGMLYGYTTESIKPIAKDN